MIKSLKIENFRRFETVQISLDNINIFVGPNNTGKSTILDAFRLLSGALRFARNRNSTIVTDSGGVQRPGYQIPHSMIPINVDNIHRDYKDVPTKIYYNLENEKGLVIEFNEQNICKLTISTDDLFQITTKEFIRHYDKLIACIPTLAPFEQHEDILTDGYFGKEWGSRRSSRMFRNFWLRNGDLFADFKSLVQDTWPDIEIKNPEILRYDSKEISMFYSEKRIDREIFWSGFGFQVWLQILTHVTTNQKADIFVIDEPDIYLHPDLQRKLLNILRKLDRQIVLATHSVEIINEADRNEVIMVDHDRKRARRINDLEGLQDAVAAIGSVQNIEISRLSRDRRVVFFEGNDFKIVRRIARQLRLDDLASAVDITIIPIGGFSQHTKIKDASWTFETILKSKVNFAALFDRDYRSNKEIEEFVDGFSGEIDHLYVLGRKEIENYLIIPHAIQRAVFDRMRARGDELANDDGKIGEVVHNMLLEVTDSLRDYVLAQLCSQRIKFGVKKGQDQSTIVQATIEELGASWDDLNYRIKICPGKTVFSNCNRFLQENHSVSITPFAVIGHMRVPDIPDELRGILGALNEFAQPN